MRAEENAELQKSYLSYTVLRLPVMLEWQRRAGGNDFFAAAGPLWSCASKTALDIKLMAIPVPRQTTPT